MDADDLEQVIAGEAYASCAKDFREYHGRMMNDEESAVAARAAGLAVEWSRTQSADELARCHTSKQQHRRAKRACRKYVEENWDEGYGFLFSLLSAIIWHLIVVLIVRAIIRHYFNNPEHAVTMCRAT